MPTASFYEGTGISVAVYKPSIDLSGPTYDPEGEYLFALTDQLNDYEHAIAAWRGFLSVRIRLTDNVNTVEDWFESGLGRFLRISNRAGGRVHEVVVNQIEIELGGVKVTRGPMFEIANRASVAYAIILDDTVAPPVVGDRTVTTLAENADSQARYGIIEQTLSGGTLNTTDAEQLRDTFVAENANPETSQTLSIGGEGGLSITLDCVGFWKWLDVYPYSAVGAGTQSNSAKIIAALDADQNDAISTDQTRIDANGYLTTEYDNDDSTALSVIKATVALGDAGDDRWLFGVYEDQIPYYQEMPTDIAYVFSIADPAQHIKTYDCGAIVDPWDVRPGRWLFYSDFLVNRPQSSVMREDPRVEFIEEVRYRFPTGLEINGRKVGTLQQLLAKFGLGGRSS